MSEDLQADVIVIGSGATGLAAALTAAEGGAKVMVFEKQRSPGGTSNFFGGIFAVESFLQREKYITFSKDDAFKAVMEYSHWRANPRLVRAIVNETAATISWLIEQGVEITEATINMPNTPMVYHPIKGRGAALVKALVTKAKEKGADIRLGVPVTSILKEGDRISGVVYESNDEEFEVAAKAVVVATGGYANNKAWIKKYTGMDLDVNLIPIGNVDKTGDGIRMAWEAGAAADGLGVLEIFAAGPVGPDFDMKNEIELISINPNLWVNPLGERYCDETITFYDTQLGNANAKYPYTFRLFDDSLVEWYKENGTEKGMGVEIPPGTKPLNFDKEFAAALERGSQEVFKADSLEELAEKIGADPAVLRATVDEYNSFCAKGHDDLFAKEQKYLKPLLGPKFYAVRARSVFLGTMGGIKINHNMEVVDKKDKVIKGLYAGGFDAAGMWGDSYCITSTSGLSSAFALNSGRIAGRSALKYIGK
jgi:fumarate reductase flavoprotein subunit